MKKYYELLWRTKFLQDYAYSISEKLLTAIVLILLIIPELSFGQPDSLLKREPNFERRGRIVLTDTIIRGSTVDKYIFYNSEGKIKDIKIANFPDGTSEFPDYSPFRNLKLSGMTKVPRGDFECDLKNIPFEERQRALREIGVESIPLEVITMVRERIRQVRLVR